MPEDGRAVYEAGEREESCIAATTSFLCHFRLLIAASLQHCAAARPTPSARQQLFLQVIGFFFLFYTVLALRPQSHCLT